MTMTHKGEEGASSGLSKCRISREMEKTLPGGEKGSLFTGLARKCTMPTYTEAKQTDSKRRVNHALIATFVASAARGGN